MLMPSTAGADVRSEFACLFRGGVTGAHLSPEGNEDIDKQRLTLLWRG